MYLASKEASARRHVETVLNRLLWLALLVGAMGVLLARFFGSNPRLTGRRR